MQQIVHHLRCRKAGVPAEQASAFEEISCVVPFIEMAYDVGVDLLAEQVALPRCEPWFARRHHCACWVGLCSARRSDRELHASTVALSARSPPVSMLQHLTRLDGQCHRRLFKTHCWYDHCPKGARYVWVVRDPMDVSLSFYKFFEGWLFEPDHVQLDEFIQQFILGRGASLSSFRRGLRLGDRRWTKPPLQVQQRSVRP
jgi:hypothetical protein